MILLVAEVLCFRYNFDMTKFNDIYEFAADNHGLITSKQAKSAGISNNELVQYARRGKIEKVGYGLYKLKHWVPEINDSYALAVQTAGEGALLYGESVLAMLELAPTNPNFINVATPRRIRRKLPTSLRVTYVKSIRPTANYDGIPSQSAYDAILSCESTMMSDRLLQAADEAKQQGLIREGQFASLQEELEGLNE